MTHKLWTIHRILHDLLGISEEEIGEGFSLRHAAIQLEPLPELNTVGELIELVKIKCFCKGDC